MSTVQDIEEAVKKLSEKERAKFRAWYAKFDGEEWDRQVEADVAAGKLHWIKEEARQELQQGRCTKR